MALTDTASEVEGSVKEHHLSHAMLYEIEPATLSADHADKGMFYVHGGGFMTGGGIGAAYAAYGIVKLVGLRTYSIDYRMPPASPFPAGLDDAVEAWGDPASRENLGSLVGCDRLFAK